MGQEPPRKRPSLWRSYDCHIARKAAAIAYAVLLLDSGQQLIGPRLAVVCFGQ